jgi:hypothetical protein
MSLQPDPAAAGPVPAGRRLLFTPGPRLGWVFRDRREAAAPYPEPRPDPRVIQARAAARVAGAEQSWARAWKWAGRPSIALAVILVLLAGCQRSVEGGFSPGLTLVTVVILCGPGLGYTGWCWLRRDQARAVAPEQEFHQAVAEWEERAAGHEGTELARLAGQPEWGSVSAPGQRTDIFGGTLAGWQALLTVHGASVLAERPLLAVDLTGQQATGMLSTAAREAGIPSAAYRLPQELGSCGLLTELTPAQLADAIAESLHAGAADGARSDRSVDVWILQQLTGVLGASEATPQRLAAAVRAALGYPSPHGLLSPGEQALIAGDLFPTAYRQQVTANLVRLDAVLAELTAHTGGGWPQKPGRYTCVAVDTAARSAAGEVLTALVMQWLTIQVATAPATVPAVIIAGADEISRLHAERLSDACERRGVPLTLMFRHLRDDAARLIGGGTAAFMRLANHAEAEQAATYIGRRHTFVVSSYTATRGGNQTSTHGSTDGYGTSDSRSDTRNRGWQDSGLFSPGSNSGGRARTAGTSNSRNWSTSSSQADGTSWSETATRQRVYEYAVEPTALQNLPEYALLLADRSGRDLQLHAVECDPSITGLTGVSPAPLPPPGGIQHGNVPVYSDTLPALTNHFDPAITAAGLYPPGQAGHAGPEPQPAWPTEQPELSWWQKNQPPDQH